MTEITKQGLTDSRCDYSALPSGWCEKCGNVHDGKGENFMTNTPEPSELSRDVENYVKNCSPTSEISTDEMMKQLNGNWPNDTICPQDIADRLRTLSDEVGKLKKANESLISDNEGFKNVHGINLKKTNAITANLTLATDALKEIYEEAYHVQNMKIANLALREISKDKIS